LKGELLDEANERYTRSQQQMEAKNKLCSQREGAMKKLETSLKSSQRETESLRRELKETESIRRQLRKANSDKQTLESLNEGLEEKLEEATSDLAAAEEVIDSLESEARARRLDRRRCEAELEERDEKIERLCEKLEKLRRQRSSVCVHLSSPSAPKHLRFCGNIEPGFLLYFVHKEEVGRNRI
jgi:chromosome segregation ATPase